MCQCCTSFYQRPAPDARTPDPRRPPTADARRPVGWRCHAVMLAVYGAGWVRGSGVRRPGMGWGQEEVWVWVWVWVLVLGAGWCWVLYPVQWRRCRGAANLSALRFAAGVRSSRGNCRPLLQVLFGVRTEVAVAGPCASTALTPSLSPLFWGVPGGGRGVCGGVRSANQLKVTL
jgi:hypothetical protein